MQIESLREEDVFSLTKLLSYEGAESGTKTPVLTGNLLSAIEKGHLRFFVVREGVALVGFAAYSMGFDYDTMQPCAVLHHLYLLPDFRRQGYGRAIYEFVEERIKEEGARVVLIQKEAGLAPLSLGFTQTLRSIYRKEVP
jgi:GNAT superfamily N-acetyltransferase